MSVGGDSSPVAVRLEPLGIDIEVGADETLMAAAVRLGLNWPTVCHGKAQCTTCLVKILAGVEHLSVPARPEREALLRFRGSDVDTKPESRLACQLRFAGAATVRKTGVTWRK